MHFITFVLLVLSAGSTCKAFQVHYLHQGEKYSAGTQRVPPEFHIFCYVGKPKYLIHIWQSVILQVDHISGDYTQFEGTSPDVVLEEFNANRYSWNFNLFTNKQKQMHLDPFNKSCIGIDSRDNYTVTLNVIRIDYWKFLLLLGGITLFLSASKLSRNTLFYYICGISLGICTSFLILIYLISRLFPRKPIMYGVAAFGWSIGIYLIQLLWDNVRVILLNYKIYVIWYTLITGFLSFIICYRWGPIENERSRNLIRWALQGVGLIAMFFSTQFQEAAMGQIIALLLFHNVPSTWLSKPKTYWKKRFPPKIKPITNDEYYEQGVRETAKALDDLRKYCSSPECKQWQVAMKLKDVKRFASFIEGNSHLSDEEILEYETSIHTTDLTDDESEYTDEEQ
ncbi:nuclear envelope integral membrane protein 1 [Tribolium madens]|uniref:nuclear envelope integral membrane protein 1 n=1 Tax=Tribolium madens TaxID=41895 RepID=UPI001CF7374D|nr:nuclear envelope integral membrane protein 1 [Tribolium madens]